MQCSNCGATIDPEEKFCGECGAPVVVSAHTPTPASTSSYTSTSVGLPDFIVDPTETIVARIGGDIPINLLVSQTITGWMACVTDKRLYFRGKMYSGTLRKPEVTVDSRVVDLEDITGTNFIFSQISLFALIINIIIAVAGGGGAITGIAVVSSGEGVGFLILTVGVVALATGVITAIKIWMSRHVYFSVEYPGGEIFVDASLFSLEMIDDFNKQIRRAKDRLKDKNV